MGSKQHVDGVGTATQRLSVVGLDAGSRQPMGRKQPVGGDGTATQTLSLGRTAKELRCGRPGSVVWWDLREN